MNHAYYIDNKKFFINLDTLNRFKSGKDEILSKKFNDVVLDKPWGKRGYTIKKIFSDNEFKKISSNLKFLFIDFLKKKGINCENFQLSKYHEFVDDKIHQDLFKYTRRLYPKDFKISINKIVKKIEKICKCKLSFFNPISKNTQWIIIRIIRPASTDYNPVHKDIYEVYDHHNKIPKMINCWIPVCGQAKNGLPVVPYSHLLNEKYILRTKAGSYINNKKYSVNTIKSWQGKHNLCTKSPKTNEALIFSSHIIHGLGINRKKNTTRISFELRLFEK